MNTALKELRRSNPVFTDVLVGDLSYYLEWSEDALGLFIWRAWESCVNEKRREELEKAVEELSKMRLLGRFMKFVYAARIAKKLIEKEKEMLNIN